MHNYFDDALMLVLGLGVLELGVLVLALRRGCVVAVVYDMVIVFVVLPNLDLDF